MCTPSLWDVRVHEQLIDLLKEQMQEYVYCKKEVVSRKRQEKDT
jgi:hypothetical protein